MTPQHPRLNHTLQEVMELMAAGRFGFGELAQALDISIPAARHRRDRAVAAMGCDTYPEAIARYVEWRTRAMLTSKPRRHRAPQRESLELVP